MQTTNNPGRGGRARLFLLLLAGTGFWPVFLEGAASAQECSAESSARKDIVLVYTENSLVGLSHAIEAFYAGNHRVPEDWMELRLYYKKDGRPNETLFYVDTLFVPGPHLFGYEVDVKPKWVVTLTPKYPGYPWIQLSSKGKSVGATLEALDSPDINMRFQSEFSRFVKETLPSRLGLDHESKTFSRVYSLFAEGFSLFYDQSILSRRPDLEPGMLDERGLVRYPRPQTTDKAPEGYQVRISGTPQDWQVVGWPVKYGPETPVTVCFESDGDIKVGDVGGSDDCSKVPCL